MERQAQQVALRRAMRALALVVLIANFVPCSFGERPQARKQAPRPKAAAHPKVPCSSQDELYEMPGSWASQFQTGLESSDIMSKPDLARALKDMTVYAELVHQALRIDGYVAQWYRSVGGRLFTNGPAKYQMNVPLTDFDCVDGFVMRVDEPHEERDWGSTASVAVAVNSTWHMSGPEAGTIIGGKKYYAFGTPIGEIRGFPAYQTDGGWVVLVSKPGKKPFHFATRQEVLESLEAQAEKERDDMLRQSGMLMRVRSPQEQKADHDKELALFLKGAKDDAQREHWRQRFEHDYKTDEQKLEDLRAKMNKDSDKALKHIRELIAQQTPEQRSMPAISHPGAITHVWPDFHFLQTHEETCGKGDCSGEFGVPFGIPARNYYNADLPPGRPQFFCVVFNWSGSNAKEKARLEKMRDDFFAKFDFDKLVSMLE